jgi:ferric-dicitrate binding protein FerR (iron transport regulator)
MALALFAAGLLGSLAGPARAAASAGQVVALSGQCIDEAGGQRTPLTAGATINVGDTLDVPAGAKLTVRMNDGSVLSIGSGSRMTVQTYTVNPAAQQRDVQLGLASGLMRAVVSVVNQPSTFEISTATGVAAARSTDWFVAAQPDRTQVAVLSGAVRVTGRAGGKPVMVDPNSGTEISAGRPPRAPYPVSQAQFAALIAATTVPGPVANGLGLCQCIDNLHALEMSCQPTTGACQAACAGGHYSYVPNATQSCAGGQSPAAQ